MKGKDRLGMKETLNWYVLDGISEGKFIFNEEEIQKYIVIPSPCVYLESRDELNDLELAFIREEEENDFYSQDYLLEHFELDYRYFEPELGADFYPYGQIKSLVERGVLYNVNARCFVTMDKFESWPRLWGYISMGEGLLADEICQVEPLLMEDETTIRLFKEVDEEVYYVWKPAGEENEVVVLDDEEKIELYQYPKEQVMEEIAKRYQLTLDYGTYRYWESVPHFITSKGEVIWIEEEKIINHQSVLIERDLSDLLDEIRMTVGY